MTSPSTNPGAQSVNPHNPFGSPQAARQPAPTTTAATADVANAQGSLIPAMSAAPVPYRPSMDDVAKALSFVRTAHNQRRSLEQEQNRFYEAEHVARKEALAEQNAANERERVANEKSRVARQKIVESAAAQTKRLDESRKRNYEECAFVQAVAARALGMSAPELLAEGHQQPQKKRCLEGNVLDDVMLGACGGLSCTLLAAVSSLH